jgi:hypothetical protein
MTSSTAALARESISTAQVTVDIAAFERDLTELSRKHQIGITGSMTLFVMEPDDFERRYSSNKQSQLSFS